MQNSFARRRVVLTIPRNPPPTGNVVYRLHWAQLRQLKEMWNAEVSVAAMLAGRPRFKRARISMRLYYRDRRKRDLDNIMAGPVKVLLDGLRYAKVIPDDDMATIDLAEPKVYRDKYDPRVEIEIEALPDEGEDAK